MNGVSGADRRFRAGVVQLTARADVTLDALVARIGRGRSELAVVLRDPELPARALMDQGQVLRRVTREVGALLLVADRLDVAHALEADGVHLGRLSVGAAEVRRALGDVLVTRSAHDDDELARAASEGVDAVLLSPIFASPGKGTPLGVEALRHARERLPVGVALIALGGVTTDDVPACLAAGADGVASIRADLTHALVGFAGTSLSRASSAGFSTRTCST